MPDRLNRLLEMHRRDPGDTFCTYAIAMEHVKAGAWVEAIGWLDKTIELDADYAYAYFQKARCLMEDGQEAAATEAVDQGLEAARRAADEKAIEELTELKATLGS